MKFSTFAIATSAFLAATSVVGVIAADSSLPDKLQVGVKYRPEVCEDKSQAGDLLAMHYTGTLVSLISSSSGSRIASR